MAANDTQIAGDHYLKGKNLQHWDWVEANNIGYLEAYASKYVIRWRDKNGVQDLNKAKHCIFKLIELAEDGERQNKAVPERLSTLEFAKTNDLNDAETSFCIAMLNWKNISDLNNAILMLDVLISGNM